MTTPALCTLYVYLTSGCNCACQHCWFVPEVGGSSASGSDMLDPAVLRRAIEQAIPLGLDSLKWTGGEPTLHPQFPDFLALQKEFELGGLIETNGMLLSATLVEQIVAAGVTNVSVSLDGANAATHDSIRGVEGGFDRTLAGIRELVTAGLHPELILTLQRENVAELDAFFTLAEELAAGSVELNILQPVLRGAALERSGGMLSIAEMLEINHLVNETWPEQFAVPINLDIPMAFRPLSKMMNGQSGGACSIMSILGVLPRGDYALCGVGQHLSELAMGSVMETSLKEVWEKHPVLTGLRANLPERLQGICAECLMRSACLGCCVAANYHQSSDLLAPYWFCRLAEEAGMFPGSRRR
jgi:SynChlorMet cassette radical SAM/SPASM protein ScmF